MKTINKITRKIGQLIEIVKRRIMQNFHLIELEKSGDEEIFLCIKVFRFFKSGRQWPEAEKAEINKINNLRQRLSAEQKTVLVQDYGAGSHATDINNEHQDKGLQNIRTISEVYQSAACPSKWGELFYKIILEFKSKSCLELGTNLGVSGCYQIAAQKLNKEGKFITIEGSDELAKIAKNNFKSLDYTNYEIVTGRFSDTLPSILSQHNEFDFVFIDGHHDKDATLQYFEQIYPSLKNFAIICFDDINWSEGMQAAWSKIYQDQRIKISFDLYKMGICLVNKEGGQHDFKKVYNLYM